MAFLSPPRWTNEQLQAARDVAQELFRVERMGPGPGEAFSAQWLKSEP